MASVIEVVDLRKHYYLGSVIDRLLRRGRVSVLRAVDGVSFKVEEGEALGIVGESGSGKSVTGELLVGLQVPSEGSVAFRGEDLGAMGRDGQLEFRRRVQIVFQNPYEALNPARRVRENLREPMAIHRGRAYSRTPEAEQRIHDRLAEVGLSPPEMFADRYPHELSGGEQQRVGIARALLMDPEMVVADEPTSMLDVSIRAGILNLLRELRQSRGLAMVFISHDFSTVRYVCDRTAVMYYGQIMEIGPTTEVIERRAHPYTKALLAAVPRLPSGTPRERVMLEGPLPDPLSPAGGCRFASRCPHAETVCWETVPPAVEIGDGHQVACHLIASGDLTPEGG